LSEFDGHSYNQIGQDPTPTESMDKTSWRRKTLALWHTIWTPKKRSGTGVSGGLNPGSSSAPSRWKNWPVKVLLLLLVLPVAGVTIGYITRLKAGTGGAPGSVVGSSIGTLTHGTTAKPAPGKPFVPETEPPPASPAPQVPAATAPQHAPAAAPAAPQIPAIASSAPIAPPPAFKNAPPPTPTVTTGTRYAPVVYPARHDKHFGDGCSGRLTLNSSGLQFDCPDDPSGGVQVAINQIGSVDENGIRLTSGKKYHFSIPGMSKISEQELFADWFNRVR
jgi:hypothetical protein